jgi:hypothetical protein
MISSPTSAMVSGVFEVGDGIVPVLQSQSFQFPHLEIINNHQ